MITLWMLSLAFLAVCTGGGQANDAMGGHHAPEQRLPAVIRASSVDRNPARSTVGLVTTWHTKRRLSSRAWQHAAELAFGAGMLRPQPETIVDRDAGPMPACGGLTTWQSYTSTHQALKALACHSPPGRHAFKCCGSA